MEELIERRWNALCEAIVEHGDHPESWNRAAALAEVRMVASQGLFVAAWIATSDRRDANSGTREGPRRSEQPDRGATQG